MEIYPEKGRYLPGEPIELTILYDGNAERFRVSVFLLERRLYVQEIPRTGGQTRVTLKPIYAEFCGLGILCETEHGESCCCAADVQGETRAFRYGFLSDFTPETDEYDGSGHGEHHVNAVQFYDWSSGTIRSYRMPKNIRT